MSPATSRPSTEKHWLPGVWPGRVDELDVARRRPSTTSPLPMLAPARPRTRPWRAPPMAPLSPWTCTGTCDLLEEVGDPLDPVPHEVAADVVGVEVGGEHPRATHAVGGEDVEEPADVVGGVHDHRLAGLAVADQVGRSSPSGGPRGRWWRSHAPTGAGGNRGGHRPWPDGMGGRPRLCVGPGPVSIDADADAGDRPTVGARDSETYSGRGPHGARPAGGGRDANARAWPRMLRANVADHADEPMFRVRR